MALGMAVAEANGFLNAHLKGTSFGGNANIWVKLHTGDPGTGGANAAAETTRQQASFGTPAGGSVDTDADLDWLDVAATEVYTHYSLWTAATSGTFVGSGTISGGSVSAGNNFKIPSGDFSVGISALAA